MRLFVAIDIPECLKSALNPLFQEPLPGLKWADLQQIHLTLRFIGESDCQSFAGIREAFAELKYPVFTLSPQGLGVFPNLRRPRILWLGLKSDPKLFDLQKGIETALVDLGLPAETKPFIPHLSLGRCRFPAPQEMATFLAQHGNFSAASFSVSHFHLYSSHLSPKGSAYRREASYPLL